MLENFSAVKLCTELQSTLRAPPALPLPAHSQTQDPTLAQGHQPQLQQGCSRARLQLPTALPCCRPMSWPGLVLSPSKREVPGVRAGAASVPSVPCSWWGRGMGWAAGPCPDVPTGCPDTHRVHRHIFSCCKEPAQQTGMFPLIHPLCCCYLAA